MLGICLQLRPFAVEVLDGHSVISSLVDDIFVVAVDYCLPDATFVTMSHY